MAMPLIPELSRISRAPRRRSPSALLCALVLLGAAACSGTIEGDDLDDSRARASDSPEDQSDDTRESTTRDRAAAQDEDDADERALGEDEQDEDDVRGISGRPRASGGAGRRSQADRDDEELADAGLDDAGDGDAGIVVDAGVLVDAGVVEVDAGVDVDAGAP
jgi:hypothetical protein